MQCFLVLMLAGVVRGQYYDSFTGNKINQTRYEELQRIGLVPVCAMRVDPCDANEPRRMDLSCNNLRHPTRGPAFTPFTRMLPPVFGEGGELRRAKSGRPLPDARALRVALMSDGRRSDTRHTHMLVNFNVFVASATTSVHDTVNYVAYTVTCCAPGGDQNPQCMPIKVKDDDIHLRRSNIRCMNLTRAITYQQLGCVSDEVPRERINLSGPMLDLSSVYGNSGNEARRGREMKGGRMRATTINGKEWPPSGGSVCLNNVPPRETYCYDSPSPSVNSLLGINIVFLWFYRNHNAIADALKKMNPCWDDNKLYFTAREINIAYFAQIMYYEMMPELFGWDFLLHNKIVFNTEGHVNDYDPTLEPRLTIEHSTSTRWFHTLQEGTNNLYKPDGRLYGSLQSVDMILRSGALLLDGNIEGITQGSFRQPGGAQDQVVDPDIGERVLGRLQFASDVLANDIMKGRDFGLPPYNDYRKACRLPVAKKFKDLLGWMDQTQVEAMATFYEHTDDIDLIAALLAEKPMPGAVLSPTLACIIAEQLVRWRRADRFWFEHQDRPQAFSIEQLREIRKMTFAKLLCQHGDSVSAVQPKVFLLPGDGNEIASCSKYEMPDLRVFRDPRCYPHPTPRHEDNPHPTPHEHEHTTLKDYLTQIFDTNKMPISYPNSNPYFSSSYPNDLTKLNNLNNDPTFKQSHNSDPTFKQGHNSDPKFKQGYDNDPLKSGQFNDPTASKQGSIYDPTKLNLFNVDPTALIYNEGDPISFQQGYNHDPRLSKLGQNDDLKLVRSTDDPRLLTYPTKEERLNPKMSSLFPSKQPNVEIYPNADQNHKMLKEVSSPSFSNLDSNSRVQDLKYPPHSSLRNQNYPFEEFLQNYLQASYANPFKAFMT